MKHFWVVAMLCAGILGGCSSHTNPPNVKTPDGPQFSVGSGTNPVFPTKLGLKDDDFCADGVSVGVSLSQLGAQGKTLGDRRLGGYDYALRFTDIHIGSDGKTVDVVQSYVSGLCANQTRLKLGDARAVTRDQVRDAFGEPSIQVTEGDEHWFFVDAEKDRVLIFRFEKDKGLTAERVQVARLSAAKRLWYPLLGKDFAPKPITGEDVAIGPIVVGMEADAVERVLGETGSEGAKPPYSTLLFRNKQVEIHLDQFVRAAFVAKDSSLATPRGIRVGSTADEVRAAYGTPRVVRNGMAGEFAGDYWSYENLRNGVGLVFTIRDAKVVHIMALDSGYRYRPAGEE